MGRRSSWGWRALGVVALGVGLTPAPARAQFGLGGPPMPPSGGAALVGAGQGVSPNANGTGLYANPYANPAMNPFTNPMMMMGMMAGPQNNVSAQNTALYFIAAQQMNGGLGSGRLGGSRGAQAPKAAAVAARSGGANIPGASASRYFNRTSPLPTGAAAYYGRQNPHFPSNGR